MKAVTFLKKSNQKTICPLRSALAPPKPREADKKFLRAFFKKRFLLDFF
jgi:hypothetical protein